MINCPNCSAAIDEADKECPRCGIFFSKWTERQNNVDSGNTSRYAALATSTSSEFNWTILVIVCLVILGILYFLGHNNVD